MAMMRLVRPVVREEPPPDQSFEGLLVPLLDRLWSFARRLSPEQAEDLLQEAVLKAYRFFNTLQDRQKFKPWIFQILHRQWLSVMRNRRPFLDLPFDEIVVKHFWRAVQSARRGQANGVNLTEVPHMIITNALHTMVYEDPKKTEGQEVSVNIVYTDGSQARPFPLFSLQQRSNEEMYELRQIHPLKIGMLSMRHPEMDSLIQQYWFRNIEISQPGMTSAEVDELCYQLTLKKLADVYHFNKPVRIAFYQTGFQAPLIGFWRAVVEFLKLGQGKSPMLEVIPYFYKKSRNAKFDRGERWH